MKNLTNLSLLDCLSYSRHRHLFLTPPKRRSLAKLTPCYLSFDRIGHFCLSPRLSSLGSDCRTPFGPLRSVSQAAITLAPCRHIFRLSLPSQSEEVYRGLNLNPRLDALLRLTFRIPKLTPFYIKQRGHVMLLKRNPLDLAK